MVLVAYNEDGDSKKKKKFSEKGETAIFPGEGFLAITGFPKGGNGETSHE